MCFCVNLSPSGDLSKKASCHNCKPGKEQGMGLGGHGRKARFLPLTFFKNLIATAFENV